MDVITSSLRRKIKRQRQKGKYPTIDDVRKEALRLIRTGLSREAVIISLSYTFEQEHRVSEKAYDYANKRKKNYVHKFTINRGLFRAKVLRVKGRKLSKSYIGYGTSQILAIKDALYGTRWEHDKEFMVQADMTKMTKAKLKKFLAKERKRSA